MCPFSWAIFAIVAIGNNRKNYPWGSGASPDKANGISQRLRCVALLTEKFRRKFRSKSVCALLSSNARGKKWTRSGRITQLAQRHLN